MTKHSKQRGRLDTSLHVEARHEHGTRAVERDRGWDDDAFNAVCRDRQSWNAVTHLLERAERRQDDQADAP